MIIKLTKPTDPVVFTLAENETAEMDTDARTVKIVKVPPPPPPPAA